MKSLPRILFFTLLLAAGLVGVWYYQGEFSAQRRIAQLEEQKRALEHVVERLSADRRVAEILVTKQWTEAGVPRTELLFVEYARDGKSTLPAKQLTVEGKMVHVDALVIKFDRGFVKEGDPLRGRSLALFERIYGDQQKPADAPRIDEPGRMPAFYTGADPAVSDFEAQLWKEFWRLADDENFRKEKGVRVAQGEAVYLPFEPGKLYTLSLEASGGLNMTSEPVKGIYREALKQSAKPPT